MAVETLFLSFCFLISFRRIVIRSSKSLYFKPKFNFLLCMMIPGINFIPLGFGCIFVLLCSLPAALKFEKHRYFLFLLQFIIETTLIEFICTPISFEATLWVQSYYISPTLIPHLTFLERRNWLSPKGFFEIYCFLSLNQNIEKPLLVLLC